MTPASPLSPVFLSFAHLHDEVPGLPVLTVCTACDCSFRKHRKGHIHRACGPYSTSYGTRLTITRPVYHIIAEHHLADGIIRGVPDQRTAAWGRLVVLSERSATRTALRNTHLLGGHSTSSSFNLEDFSVCELLLTGIQQPTEFWLTVYGISHVFDTPSLIQSLSAFTEKNIEQSGEGFSQQGEDLIGSLLFLRVQAVADYFTTNKSLMQRPPLVHADIILDRYLLNVFPESLVPTAGYLMVLAILAFFVSGQIWEFLRYPSRRKQHQD